MNPLKINHFAVVICALLGVILSAGWYGVFSEKWMALNQITLDMVKEASRGVKYLAAFISSLMGSYILAWLFIRIHIKSGMDGLFTGFIIGFGLVFMSLMINNLFELRPYALSWINGGIIIIWLSITGWILGTWKTYAA
jgi:hypothetical protein